MTEAFTERRTERRLFLTFGAVAALVGIVSSALVAAALLVGMSAPPRVLAYVDFNLNTPLQDLILLDFDHALRIREPLQVEVGALDWTQRRLIVMAYGSSGQWQSFYPRTAESVIETRGDDEFAWLWSPDERYLAYSALDGDSGANQLHVLNTDDDSLQVLSNPNASYNQPLLWSADSAGLIYQWQPSIGMGSLYHYAPETRTRTLIAEAASDPAWSPDGRQIIYTAYVGETTRPRLEIYDLKSEQRRVLLPEDENDQRTAAWSPDGEWIALAYDDAMAVVRPDGSDLHVLTSPFFVSNPLWSPDSRSLIFIAGAGLTSLYKIDDVQAAITQTTQTQSPVDPLTLTLDRQIYGVYPVWQPFPAAPSSPP